MSENQMTTCVSISRRLYEDLKLFLQSEAMKPEAFNETRALLVRLRESDNGR